MIFRVGANVDSYCGPCGFLAAHTVLTIRAELPYQVRCRTCRADHCYRVAKPVLKPSKKPNRAPQEAIPARNFHRERWMACCLNGQRPQVYQPGLTFEAGDLIGHPVFGLGSVLSRSGDRIWVLFETMEKQLICKS